MKHRRVEKDSLTIFYMDKQCVQLIIHHPLIMHASGPQNPLHGITLEKMLTDLVAHYGWEILGQEIRINCFNSNPTIKSSLKFLRRMPWARTKVEGLYLDSLLEMRLRAEDKVALLPPPPTD